MLLRLQLNWQFLLRLEDFPIATFFCCNRHIYAYNCLISYCQVSDTTFAPLVNTDFFSRLPMSLLTLLLQLLHPADKAVSVASTLANATYYFLSVLFQPCLTLPIASSTSSAISCYHCRDFTMRLSTTLPPFSNICMPRPLSERYHFLNMHYCYCIYNYCHSNVFNS